MAGVSLGNAAVLGKELEKGLRAKVSNTESVMSAGVCRLYICSHAETGSWKYTGISGALALVCDRALHRYLFRIYVMDSTGNSVGDLSFQYELHYNMAYKATLPYFHVFSTGDNR